MVPRPSPARILILLASACIVYLFIARLSPSQMMTPLPRVSHGTKQPSDTAAGASIPQKMWQTAPTPLHAQIFGPGGTTNATSLPAQGRAGSWVLQNPAWEYECLDDAAADAWVRDRFNVSHGRSSDGSSTIELRKDGGGMQWMGEIYLALEDRILKADLLRYMLLYIEGGVSPPPA